MAGRCGSVVKPNIYGAAPLETPDFRATTKRLQAIAKDPSIAPAYAGLAVAYAWRSFRGPIDSRRVEELDKMRAVAERAVQLDERLPEAQSALTTAFARDGHWILAERSFRHAIDLDPGLSTTHDLAPLRWRVIFSANAARCRRFRLTPEPRATRMRPTIEDGVATIPADCRSTSS